MTIYLLFFIHKKKKTSKIEKGKKSDNSWKKKI